MQEFYPLVENFISTPYYIRDTLRINIVESHSTCERYNIKLYYKEDLDHLALELINQTNRVNDTPRKNLFFMEERFLYELHLLEKMVWIDSDNEKRAKGTFEFIAKHRRVYDIPLNSSTNSEAITANLLDLIHRFSLKKE